MEEFAKKIDNKAKKGTISNWENGKNLPNKKRLSKIAELGNTTVEELLYNENQEKLVLGYEIYTELLFEFFEDTFKGKALRYFDNEKNKKFILEILSTFSIKYIRKNKHSRESLKISITQKFVKEYIKLVKNNETFIENTLDDISNAAVNAFYFDEYDFKSIEKLEKCSGYISVMKLEQGIDENLRIEIQKIFTEAEKSIKKLKDKYDNAPSKIETNLVYVNEFGEPTNLSEIVYKQDDAEIMNTEKLSDVEKEEIRNILPKLKDKYL